MAIESVNPTNGEIIKTYKVHTDLEVGEKISNAHKSFLSWRNTSFEERAVYLRKAASLLRNKKRELAELMALEMGKPIKAGEGEIEKCAHCCDFYADKGAEFLKPENIETDATKSYVTFQPLGVILAIMPWNFPFWQAFRFIAPGLIAGNCAVLKHSSNVPGCAIAIEEILRSVGFPDGVFQTLLIGSQAIDKVIENPLIKAITLTGSTQAGKKVAQKAASLIKKTVLELGGNDPYIILEDADIELAAEICTESRLINSGQSCIAGKRFIVLEKIGESFITLFKQKMAAKQMGNPFDESTDIGPQARIDLRNELHTQVEKSIALGAKCILGGEIPPGNHAFYPATILVDVKQGMPAYDEELFGPVASVIFANTEQEAVRIANDTVFGLGAAVFSTNADRAEEIAARQLNAGACFVNDFVKSDPRLPFGGINESGFGRELGSYGIKEFVNIKTVYVR